MKIQPTRNYLKTSDLVTGDIITIKSAGEVIDGKFPYPDGNPKKEYIFKVDKGGEVKDMRFNKYSRDALMEAFGDETEAWVGKQAKVVIEVVRSLGKNMVILEPVVDSEGKSAEDVWSE